MSNSYKNEDGSLLPYQIVFMITEGSLLATRHDIGVAKTEIAKRAQKNLKSPMSRTEIL